MKLISAQNRHCLRFFSPYFLAGLQPGLQNPTKKFANTVDFGLESDFVNAA